MMISTCVEAPAKLQRGQKIYDAVHGFIRFNAIERKLIDSEPFQRLHHLHQLGIAYIVYPGATHTRFEHSLGTMELATRIFERIAAKAAPLENEEYWLQVIRLAALCHDLGHLPFSHDAEQQLLGSGGHERWTLQAIQSAFLKPVWEMAAEHFPGQEIVSDVIKMAVGEKKLAEMGMPFVFSPMEKVLCQVITGDFFGADRIDYLLRDAQCTGVSYGLFDYHQLIEMLCIIPVGGEWELGIEENGIESCEALLLARHFMHQRVYQYSSVKTYKFHLSRFMVSFYAGGNYLGDLEGYLSLSDSEIIAALRRAAKDSQMPGHADADAVVRRESRFRAIALKEGIGEGEILEAAERAGVPAECLFREKKKEGKGSSLTLSFSVQTRCGVVVPA
ncbi:MAG: HD domain-containing protein, partial [Chlamydiota bacterium]